MIEDARIRGGLVLATVLVAVGLALELLSMRSPAVGFGVIFGGWGVLVLTLVRLRALQRIRG